MPKRPWILSFYASSHFCLVPPPRTLVFLLSFFSPSYSYCTLNLFPCLTPRQTLEDRLRAATQIYLLFMSIYLIPVLPGCTSLINPLALFTYLSIYLMPYLNAAYSFTLCGLLYIQADVSMIFHIFSSVHTVVFIKVYVTWPRSPTCGYTCDLTRPSLTWGSYYERWKVGICPCVFNSSCLFCPVISSLLWLKSRLD